MRGGRFVWLVSLPLALAGCLTAHGLAYVLAGGDVAGTGHGYLDHLPLLAAGGLTIVLVAACWHAVAGRAGARASSWLFAVLPPAAFVLQEHLERAVTTGALPLDAALEPSFVLGLALQLPFALLARLLAGAVLGAAESIVARLRARHARARSERAPAQPPLPPFAASLAFGLSGRGPPPRRRPR